MPTALLELTADADRGRADRAFAAMLQMKKIDIAAIEAFLRGERPPPPLPRQSGLQVRALLNLREQERAWVARGADPRELTDEQLFAVDLDSDVIAPPDVFLFTFTGPVLDEPGKRYVGRGQGYETIEGRFVWQERDEQQDADEPHATDECSLRPRGPGQPGHLGRRAVTSLRVGTRLVADAPLRRARSANCTSAAPMSCADITGPRRRLQR